MNKLYQLCAPPPTFATTGRHQHTNTTRWPPLLVVQSLPTPAHCALTPPSQVTKATKVASTERANRRLHLPVAPAQLLLFCTCTLVRPSPSSLLLSPSSFLLTHSPHTLIFRLLSYSSALPFSFHFYYIFYTTVLRHRDHALLQPQLPLSSGLITGRHRSDLAQAPTYSSYLPQTLSTTNHANLAYHHNSHNHVWR